MFRTATPALFAIASAIGLWSTPGSAQALTPVVMDICPNSFSSIPMDTPPIICGCAPEAVKKNDTVWGANPYYRSSSICRAAAHAGAIGPQGGQVTVKPAPKVPFFPSVTKNEITTASTGADDGFSIDVSTKAEAPAAAPPAPNVMAMDICPNNFGSIPMDTPPIACGCLAETVKKNDTVWGANPYYRASSICRAAAHAGAIGLQGGQVTVKPAPKIPFFPSVTKNGISTASASADDGFIVEVSASAEAPAKASSMPNVLAMDICPNNFGSVPMDAPAIACGCSADAVKKNDTIWGANPYYRASSICRAAAHAGAIGLQGGEVTVTPAPKIPFFPSVTKNGIASASSNADDGFSITVSNRPVAPAPQPGGIAMEICPNNYGSIPMDTPPITCGCSPEAAKRNDTVWGGNPYYRASSLCRAAVHAGAIGLQGGDITVSPAPKIPFFPSVTKNGVQTASTSADDGFRVAAPRTPPAPVVASAPVPSVDSSGKPVQAPIAQTLKAVGRVQVYVNFATASDRIEPNSAAVLAELLTTLRDAPALRIELVGHTDSQGSAPYNLDLSQRRAASVYGWLAQRGVERERLRSSGRGLLEPIADNGSDQGRALNRRVEVKAIN